MRFSGLGCAPGDERRCGSVNLIRIEFAGLDDDLRFGHGDFAAGGGVGIEVVRGASIDKVAVAGRPSGFYQGDVGLNAAFEDVGDSVGILVLFAFGDHGADAGARIEAGNAGAACAHALGERALRAELDFQLAGQKLAFELDVLANVAGDHLADLMGFKEQAETPAVDAGVVAGDGEVADAGVAEGRG